MNTPRSPRASQQRVEPPPSSFSVGDIYFILFRHKWKILACALSGIIAAALIYVFNTPLYRSDAKLLIRYVVDERQREGQGNDKLYRSPDDRGSSIINSEIELLTSRDLAVSVVESVGTKKILQKLGGGTNLFDAVVFVRQHLTIATPAKSTVIILSFEHPDPQVSQEILGSMVTSYLEKHVEIHKAAGAYEVLQRQTDQLRSRLMETEKELSEVKRAAGIVSLEDARKEQSTSLDTLRKNLLETEQDLVTRKAKVAEMEKWIASIQTNNLPAPLPPGTNSTASATNLPASSNAVDVAALTPVRTNDFIIPIHKRLSDLYLKKLELLGQLKPDSPYVQQMERQIAQLEQIQKEWEAANPTRSLAIAGPAGPVISNAQLEQLLNDRNEIVAKEAKVGLLNAQLDKIKGDASALDKVENRIRELTRQKEMEEANFKYFNQGLEQARIDSSLESGRSSNISLIQAPSFGVKDSSTLYKRVAIALAVGLFGGLALALLIEYFLDQSVRRPSDVESKTKSPLFLTIPKAPLNGSGKNSRKPKSPKPPGNGAEEPDDITASPVNTTGDVAPWEQGHKLRPYYESLRDRLITYFEVRGMNHKPKLVAVTGCSRGSGVTSIAAGLAAALSETGDGNVLLVDLNSGQGAAHPFYRGKPCALPETLESENREAAMVQEHLYWVAGAEPSDRLPRVLPKRLMHLVPKLKTSDYDYIIFDMPTISQTSAVPRLASMMDMTFFIVESDKTHRDAMERALSLLAESKANVAAVLNKYQKRVPDRLQQEV
jgi:uncharacterized protein involved in exopolysaccharide biosynthesis/Mrp family chromosome partitioning ATPase